MATCCTLQAQGRHERSECQNYAAQFPRPVSTQRMFGRAILARDAVQTPDVSAILSISRNESWRRRGPRDRCGAAAASGRAYRRNRARAKTPGEFSATQIELLQTFAEQAVIAITSVARLPSFARTHAELTRSVAELQALEEVLRAVNSSLDLDTVLATIVSRAVQLSQADEGTIYEFDDVRRGLCAQSRFWHERGAGGGASRPPDQDGRNPSRPQCSNACPVHVRTCSRTLDA